MDNQPLRDVSDEEADFDVQPDFAPFNQKDDVFRRSWWDPRVRTEKARQFYDTSRQALKNWRRGDGFTQKDYALRNAAWHVSDWFTEYHEDQDRREGFTDEFSLYRDVAEQKVDLGDRRQSARTIKRVALAFGADDVGITHHDPRWLYTRKYSDLKLEEKPQEIPPGMKHVIVVAQAMDLELLKTVPSALSGAATGLGYSKDAMVVLSIAQFIRNLGYNAIASMNDTSLSIPLAIKAGLGEYARNGLLITKRFGPRVRLGKIYTDLPLANDRPVRFGVKQFCDICRRCSDACPVNAIPDGPPSTEIYNQSNIKGIRKWSVDGEKCFSFWASQNSDCSICIRVCPYNKDYSRWWVRLGQRLAFTPLRRLILWLDHKLGFGARVKPKHWWDGPSAP